MYRRKDIQRDRLSKTREDKEDSKYKGILRNGRKEEKDLWQRAIGGDIKEGAQKEKSVRRVMDVRKIKYGKS